MARDSQTARVDAAQRPRLLRPETDEHRTTFLELFFDLVFVLAITQLSGLLRTHLSIEGGARTGFLLLVVWWAWIYTTWMTNWFDPERVTVRLVLLAGTGASLAMALAIPAAFGSRGLLFAGGYVTLQGVRNTLIVAATEPTSPLHLAFRRILAWSSWVGVIWVAGGIATHGTRVVIWIVALVLDYAGPLAGYWTPGLGRTEVTDWEIEHAHFAERFQTFIMIALGESVVATGATAAQLPLTLARDLAMALAFLLAALLWWLYFDEVADRSAEDLERAEDARGQLGRDAYTYLHIPIVAGIIISAVGAGLVIAHPAHRLGAARLVALAAGPAVYLLGHIAFRLRMIGSVAPKRVVAAALILAATAVTATLPALAPAAAIVTILAVLAASETAGRLRHGYAD